MQLSKKIYRLAFPTILGFFGLTAFEIADIFWIGKIGPKAVAAIAASSFIEWILYAIMCLSGTGTSTLVAQFYGAGKKKEVFDVGREALHLSLVVSLMVVVILLVAISSIFNFMGLDVETHSYAMKYFRILILGFPVLYIFSLQGLIFNAHGDTKTSTLTMLLAIFLNIILDPFFIFGWWGFPKLGVMGASIASILSTIIGMGLRTYLIRKKDFAAPFRELFITSRNYTMELLRIGTPAAINNAVWSFSFPLLATLITKFGMEPLAGLNIGNRIEGIPYFISVGFGIAVSTMVGQSFGRGNKPEVNRILKRGLAMITLILTPISLLFIFIPEDLIALLNTDPEVIKHGASYLRIIGYFEIFLGWELVIEGAFNGLGNTRPYMLIRVPLTLARIPLAYLFAFKFGYGINGIWWAITLSTFTKAIVLLVAFKANRKNQELLSV